MSNLILLRHLAEIAMSKRINDGRESKKPNWREYYGTVLLMRMQQVERLKKELADRGNQNNFASRRKQHKTGFHVGITTSTYIICFTFHFAYLPRNKLAYQFFMANIMIYSEKQ